MLVWVTAMHCEAKPIIDYYRLKKSQSNQAFDVYQGKRVECIVSGIGKSACAAATAWIAALNHQARTIAWINIGIAGSATHDIGTAVLIDRISETAHDRHRFPRVQNQSAIQLAHCQTLDYPSTDYHPGRVYDMEASAFFDTATRFSPVDLVQCVKIISDNPHTQIGKNKPAISKLISQQMEPLIQLAQGLRRMSRGSKTLRSGLARISHEGSTHD